MARTGEDQNAPRLKRVRVSPQEQKAQARLSRIYKEDAQRLPMPSVGRRETADLAVEQREE